MNGRIVAWGPAALWAAVLFLLSAWSRPDLGPLRVPDGVVHALLYAVLGAALWWAREHAHPHAPAWLFLALGALYGVSDEWHQAFVPGRTPSAADVAADALGTALGFAAAAAARVRAQRRTSRTGS